MMMSLFHRDWVPSVNLLPPFICPKRGVAQLHLAGSSQAGTYEPL